MSFKNIVLLGGGPVGLMAAIDARRWFTHVTIVEKRSAYSRTNVPVLQDDVRKHLNRIGVSQTAGLGTDDKKETVSLSKLEEALWEKAERAGVEMLRSFVATDVAGRDRKPDHTFRSMVLTLSEWDDHTRALKAPAATRTIEADLLVISIGGGASEDELMKKMQFTWEVLKAKNYAAFAIFEPGAEYKGVMANPTDDEPEFDHAVKKQLFPLISPVVPAKTALKTRDHNYLLVTLSGCTKADFKLLQQNTTKLKTLLSAVGKTISTTVLAEIKDVQKNVALFKIAVKKANQLYSPEYPAVLVGDAAVTPHPETGSGLVTGFKGFEELAKLFKALSKTHRSEDNRHHFMSFDESYHLFVAEKALRGTWTILDNLLKTVQAFRADLKRAFGAPSHDGLRMVVNEMDAEADRLIQELKDEQIEAEQLNKLLNGEQVQLDPKASVDRLWAKIAVTWRGIKRFTSDIGFLDERLTAIERHLQAT